MIVEISIASLMCVGTSPTTSTSYCEWGSFEEPYWILLYYYSRTLPSAFGFHGLLTSSVAITHIRLGLKRLRVVIKVFLEPLTTTLIVILKLSIIQDLLFLIVQLIFLLIVIETAFILSLSLRYFVRNILFLFSKAIYLRLIKSINNYYS